MLSLKSLLWISFAVSFVGTGCCLVFYQKAGDDVKMKCAGADPKSDTEWKLNNALLLYMSKSGRQRKGVSDTSQRTRIEGNELKISSLKRIDSGDYTCKSSSHTLYVASAHANPSSLLYSSETKLSCDVAGDFKLTFLWFSPKAELYGQEKEVTVKHVSSEHNGVWTCRIINQKQENLIELNVNINVVGPLITSENIQISEGGAAVLPCFLPTPSGLSITAGSWTRGSNPGVHLLTLMRTGSHVQWNKTGVKPEVGFTEQDLKTDFNVTLKKVRASDKGVYVCSLFFEGGKSLSANLTLTVIKRDGSTPGKSDETKVLKHTWYRQYWGLRLWVWIVIVVAVLVLIVFVVSLLFYRRNKQMKRKMKKLNSMRQPRIYCKCDRTRKQTGKTPVKNERPPPLPRHQYSSLNESHE